MAKREVSREPNGPQLAFGGTAAGKLRGVDVGYADALAVPTEGVAIRHACWLLDSRTAGDADGEQGGYEDHQNVTGLAPSLALTISSQIISQPVGTSLVLSPLHSPWVATKFPSPCFPPSACGMT